jgi:hypothetical protein
MLNRVTKAGRCPCPGSAVIPVHHVASLAARSLAMSFSGFRRTLAPSGDSASFNSRIPLLPSHHESGHGTREELIHTRFSVTASAVVHPLIRSLSKRNSPTIGPCNGFATSCIFCPLGASKLCWLEPPRLWFGTWDANLETARCDGRHNPDSITPFSTIPSSLHAHP